MRPILALAALALVAAPLTAQSNAERILNDHYTRSHDYDLIHQDISVRDFSWDSLTFRGRVATTLVSLRPGLDSVILDAGKLLQIRAVTTGTSALTYGRSGDTLVIHLAKAAGFRDTVRFAITYDAKIDNGRGLTFIQGHGRAHRPDQIWSQGEGQDNHFWFPTYDFPNDKATWSLAASVPAKNLAVANGRLVSNVVVKGVRTMTWSQDKPASTYLVSLVVAPLAKIHDEWHGIPVDYYVYHEDSALARPLFRVTPDMIDTYSRLTGVAYPWQKYSQTTVADFFGGMENVSATTLVDWLPDATAYADRPWYQYILIPHELAHQWFGDLVTTENWANIWLNEGFAEFMPGQYWGAKLGPHGAQDYYQDEYRQFMQIDHRKRMPVAANNSNNIYPKGALVLKMMQDYLGPQRFWASLHLYLTRNGYDNATTDDLRQAVLAATGENLDWFFDEWLYQAGYPEFTVTSAWDSAARQVTLSVKQTQVDTATVDTASGIRYSTPAVFRMPVTVRIGTATGEVTSNGWIDAREQTLTVPGVTSAPTYVIFDDGNRILKTLTFEQPTAMLAEALDHDADLWDRQWLIGQLEHRTTDTSAAQALAKAATGADHFFTRALASTALGGFSAGLALPALTIAAHDTSAQVRAAAVTAVGVVKDGGDQVLATVQDAWMHDRSYAVRAAALTVVARLDAADRDVSLQMGLRASSYQDVILVAALRSMLAVPVDSATVAGAEARMGDSRFAVFALQALATRGNVDAKAVMDRHLTDSRIWVRDWVEQANKRK
ncbi:MAG: M1 family metallopeptidase [Gemmatimonadales bacterium]